jgi:hypothetical protein
MGSLECSTKQCFICHETLHSTQNLRTLKCNHSFHSDCVNDWISAKGTCPTCRSVENELVYRPPVESNEEGEVYYATIRFFRR